MENDPSIEFDHYLAQKLGMTVDALRHGMSAAEYVDWQVYYGRMAQKDQIERAKRR